MRWVVLVLVASSCFPRHQEAVPDARPDAPEDSVPDAELDAPADARIDASPDAMIDARPDAPPPCVPRSCSDQHASCGTLLDNGCGAPLTCPMCDGAAECTANVCAIPAAAQECANGWCWESPTPFAFTPTQVFARTSTDVWAIGLRGVIKHFDGTSWSAVSSNTHHDLHGIYMTSATDGWIVGDGGTLLRWNGTAWASVASGTTSDLLAIHGNAPTNIWLVGAQVTKRWNGTSWANVGTTTRYLDRVFVTSNNKVFAAHNAIVVENVSGTWTARTSDNTSAGAYPHIMAFAGVGTNVYAIGYVYDLLGTDREWIWKWDGTTWTQASLPGDPVLYDGFVDGTTVYGMSGSLIWDLAAGTSTPGPSAVTMGKIAAVSGELFAIVSRGLPYRRQGGVWSTPASSNLNTATTALLGAYRVGSSMWFGRYAAAVEWASGLVKHTRPNYIDSISGTSRDDVWALDRDSFNQRSKIDHFDGVRWTTMTGPTERLEEIHATAQEVLVFGEGVFRLSGTAWVPEALPEPARWVDHAAVGDDLFLVGTDFTTTPYTPRVARRIAGTWSALPAPPSKSVCGIAAFSANDIWVTGQDEDSSTFDDFATISHWDGVAWTRITPANTPDACAIVAHAGQLWIGGTGNGTVLHRSATGTWSTLSGAPTGDVRGLAVDASGTLWAAGNDGLIMHRATQ